MALLPVLLRSFEVPSKDEMNYGVVCVYFVPGKNTDCFTENPMLNLYNGLLSAFEK